VPSLIRADLILPVIRFGIIMSLAALTLFILQRRWKVLSRFAAEDGSALNLGIARVVIMATMIAQTPLGYSLTFARLDPTLLWPPKGWSHLVPLVPLDPTIITIAYGAFLVAAVMAVIGWFGRPACAIATALAFYVQTIPQLYGKVNHSTMHLIIFGVILACSPSSDALSADAIRAAIRAADRGELRRADRGAAYGFALKAMMLVVGLAYFFPGAWKVSIGWDGWFTGTNLSRLILGALYGHEPSAFQRWMLGQPTLLFGGTIATIVFELGFVFAILFPRVRPFAALAGLGFHNAIGLLMAIPFGSLQICYVIFFDWQTMLAAVAAHRRVSRLTLLYDPHCILCRRAIGILTSFDWLDLLNPVPNEGAIDFQAVDAENNTTIGYDGYVQIARRVPILWIVSPLLDIGPVRHVGQRVYQRVATSRTCSIHDRAMPRGEYVVSAPVGMSLRVAAGGLLGWMFILGSTHVIATWPVACFPTFDKPRGPTVAEIAVEATDVAGHRYTWLPREDDVFNRQLSPERWSGQLEILLGADPFPEARARALVMMWQREHDLPPLSSARFFIDERMLATNPDSMVRIQRTPIGMLSFNGTARTGRVLSSAPTPAP
jgi:predicted DCC family thiol-disulfide oxidoreductase YuxK